MDSGLPSVESIIRRACTKMDLRAHNDRDPMSWVASLPITDEAYALNLVRSQWRGHIESLQRPFIALPPLQASDAPLFFLARPPQRKDTLPDAVLRGLQRGGYPPMLLPRRGNVQEGAPYAFLGWTEGSPGPRREPCCANGVESWRRQAPNFQKRRHPIGLKCSQVQTVARWPAVSARRWWQYISSANGSAPRLR